MIKVRYLTVDANTSHNVLLGRLSLNKLGVIISTPTFRWSSHLNKGK